MPGGSGAPWNDIAVARARESNALLVAGFHLGAVYLQGYNIECQLKHLLCQLGKRFPTSGSAGHNLRGLWETAGLPAHIPGYAGLFLEVWSTDLRYRTDLPAGFEVGNLMEGARSMAASVGYRIRSQNSRGSRHHVRWKAPK